MDYRRDSAKKKRRNACTQKRREKEGRIKKERKQRCLKEVFLPFFLGAGEGGETENDNRMWSSVNSPR